MPIARIAIFVLVAGLLAWPKTAHDAKADAAAFYAEDAVLLPPTHDVVKGSA
jgi:ketosteroid isomerase-like protein